MKYAYLFQFKDAFTSRMRTFELWLVRSLVTFDSGFCTHCSTISTFINLAPLAMHFSLVSKTTVLCRKGLLTVLTFILDSLQILTFILDTLQTILTFILDSLQTILTFIMDTLQTILIFILDSLQIITKHVSYCRMQLKTSIRLLPCYSKKWTVGYFSSLLNLSIRILNS